MLDAGFGNLPGEFANDGQRVAGNRLCRGLAIVRMIDVLESECAIRLNAIRQIRVARRHQDQVAVQGAAGIDLTCAEDARVEPVIGTEQREKRCLRSTASWRSPARRTAAGNSEDGRVVTKRPELHAEPGMHEFRPAHDGRNALLEAGRLAVRRQLERCGRLRGHTPGEKAGGGESFPYPLHEPYWSDADGGAAFGKSLKCRIELASMLNSPRFCHR